MSSLLRAGEGLTEIYNRNVDTVYRVCYSFMKNRQSAEDMVQETFLKLISGGAVFASPRHEKAWLIVTASNLCKNALRHWTSRLESIDEHEELQTPPEETDAVLEAIMSLPESYKIPVYMYYYEGYGTREIAEMLKCPHATVRTRLARARKMLKKMLGGEFDAE
ncbi:MAG: RNA polymerase sigma factor [Ruminococcus flavefaciens]|nr:RNA polymerase sigma factor [Ruminococcus flavefaciens]